jgi:hypothetical protein
VSASKPTIDAPKRKLYESPAVKQLTLEEAKKVLEAQFAPADENTKKMLTEINRRLERR